MRANQVEELADVYAGAIRILRLRGALPFDDFGQKGQHREYPPVVALLLSAQKELVSLGIPAESAALLLKRQANPLFEHWHSLNLGNFKLTVIGDQAKVASGSETAMILAGASLAGARSIVSIDLSDLLIAITIRAAAKNIRIPHYEHRGDWWNVERTIENADLSK
jgi:hypothetical protein